MTAYEKAKNLLTYCYNNGYTLDYYNNGREVIVVTLEVLNSLDRDCFFLRGSNPIGSSMRDNIIDGWYIQELPNVKVSSIYNTPRTIIENITIKCEADYYKWLANR